MKFTKCQKQLIDAFHQICIETESTNFTVEELCALAKIHPQTFYYHFDSKQDFLYFYLLYYFSDLKISKDKKSLEDNICSTLMGVVDVLKENKKIIQNIIFKDDYNVFLTKLFYDLIKDLFSSQGLEFTEERFILVYGFLLSLMLKIAYTEEEIDLKEISKVIAFVYRSEGMDSSLN